VYDSQDLLRASIYNAANQHRLGANEAPPSIISAFLGSEVSRMLEIMEKSVGEEKMKSEEKTALKLNIGRIPEIILDTTDRNRTSPFAFTGNRFEYRAVGSSANCASALMVLNSVVANQLINFKAEVDQLIKKGIKKDEAIFHILKKLIVESKPIIFNGNNYSQEWVKEAARRGLSNVNNVPEALSAFLRPQYASLLQKLEVLSHRELEGRVEVEYEKFVKKVQIESRVLGDMAINHIVPVSISYMTSLLENVKYLKDVFPENEFEEMASGRKALIKEISGHISVIKSLVNDMTEARKEANAVEDSIEKAKSYSTKVLPFLDDIRSHIDKLELIVDNDMWPLPKYRELLFIR
jgi:glutamine synthetase